MEDARVLLVEDDPNDAELVIHVLKKNNIAKDIHVVGDGKEALDFLFCRGAYSGRNFASRPDLVILDLKLPHVFGLKVLQEVKENVFTKPIPIVVLTSSDIDYDITSAYELGVNSYIQKPLEFEKFQEAVKMIGRYWLDFNKRPIYKRPVSSEDSRMILTGVK
ncbi:MAG: response regulator [Dehalococcoidia bacterium]|nr:response regulator [Dehalococcoidia bacterium]